VLPLVATSHDAPACDLTQIDTQKVFLDCILMRGDDHHQPFPVSLFYTTSRRHKTKLMFRNRTDTGRMSRGLFGEGERPSEGSRTRPNQDQSVDFALPTLPAQKIRSLAVSFPTERKERTAPATFSRTTESLTFWGCPPIGRRCVAILLLDSAHIRWVGGSTSLYPICPRNYTTGFLPQRARHRKKEERN